MSSHRGGVEHRRQFNSKNIDKNNYKNQSRDTDK